MKPIEAIEQYKKLKNVGKTAICRAFIKEFGYRNAESLRCRIRGEEAFLNIHLEFLEKQLPKYQDAEIPELVSTQ